MGDGRQRHLGDGVHPYRHPCITRHDAPRVERARDVDHMVSSHRTRRQAVHRRSADGDCCDDRFTDAIRPRDRIEPKSGSARLGSSRVGPVARDPAVRSLDTDTDTDTDARMPNRSGALP